MADIEIHDNRFRTYVPGNCRIEKLHGGMRWAEGPVYFADGDFLVWSDIPNNRMLRWVDGLGVAEFRSPSNFSNGNTRDLQGRLVTCEHGGRRVTRTEPDGSVTVVADRWRGRRLNSPNDVVVKSDGSIWFTDPDYGILTDYEGHRSPSEIGSCNVYRVDPSDGVVELVAEDFAKPNGIAFSLDESLLYVADTGVSHDPAGPHHIRAVDIRGWTPGSGRLPPPGRLFVEIDAGAPDGFRLDTEGNVWTSAGDGVHCYSPEGGLIGKILLPEAAANLEFGGRRRNRLFITATTSLYAIYVGVTGARRP